MVSKTTDRGKKIMKHIRNITVILIIALFISGCSKYSEDDLQKAIAKKDFELITKIGLIDNDTGKRAKGYLMDYIKNISRGIYLEKGTKKVFKNQLAEFNTIEAGSTKIFNNVLALDGEEEELLNAFDIIRTISFRKGLIFDAIADFHRKAGSFDKKNHLLKLLPLLLSIGLNHEDGLIRYESVSTIGSFLFAYSGNLDRSSKKEISGFILKACNDSNKAVRKEALMITVNHFPGDLTLSKKEVKTLAMKGLKDSELDFNDDDRKFFKRYAGLK
ncbi:MAG: hypothetical protein GY754_47330 [bacterium]|nr:hypothetical protein [bacterium]